METALARRKAVIHGEFCSYRIPQNCKARQKVKNKFEISLLALNQCVKVHVKAYCKSYMYKFKSLFSMSAR